MFLSGKILISSSVRFSPLTISIISPLTGEQYITFSDNLSNKIGVPAFNSSPICLSNFGLVIPIKSVGLMAKELCFI